MNKEVDEILGRVIDGLTDETIMPHNKYEDAVTDEDIVLIGQQLIDDARDEILELIDQTSIVNRLEENAWVRGQVIAEQVLHAPNSGYGRQIKTTIDGLNNRKGKLLALLEKVSHEGR